MAKDLADRGLEIRRSVLGADYVDRAMSTADDFNRDFQRVVNQYCWGEVWAESKALSKKQHSLNNLCLLAALNRPNEFEIHFRGALVNGCTLDELRETLLQIAIYAGIPAGVEAFRIARKVLAERQEAAKA
jgi:4-carboxymuconolactone decarboxylase